MICEYIRIVSSCEFIPFKQEQSNFVLEKTIMNYNIITCPTFVQLAFDIYAQTGFCLKTFIKKKKTFSFKIIMKPKLIDL